MNIIIYPNHKKISTNIICIAANFPNISLLYLALYFPNYSMPLCKGWAVLEIHCLRNAVIAPCEHNRCFHRIRKRIYNIPRIIARKIFNNRHFNHREERMFDNRVMMIKCSSHLSVLVIFTLFNADVGFCYTIYLILLIFIELSSSNLVLKFHKVWALT